MKTKLLSLTLLSAVCLLPSALHAQGTLTPPGAPAPTMKSLAQIEPRTPISSAPFIITKPGSYYLTTNLSVTAGNAITIAANSVTLDLSGFTISSTESTPAGWGVILQSAATDIAIFNGHITGSVTNVSGTYYGSGFANGIGFSGAAPKNIRVNGVSVSGCLYSGIYLFNASTTVESCTVENVGGYGIYASIVAHCTANPCGLNAIYADIASDCLGYCNGAGDGILVGTANDCNGYSWGGAGVEASTTVTHCFGICYGDYDGIKALNALGCYGFSVGNGNGINTKLVNNCYGRSTYGVGIYTDNASCSSAQSDFNIGLYAVSAATGCSGYCLGNNTGLFAATANGCYGNSFSWIGLRAANANACYGQSSSGTGLSGTMTTGCYGQSSSGVGLNSDRSATSCYGYSDSNDGMDAFLASSCFGYSSGNGIGLSAFSASVSHGISFGGGIGLSVIHNINSF
jgi:hypothetical protein